MNIFKSFIEDIITPNKLHTDYKLLCSGFTGASDIYTVNLVKGYIVNNPEVFVDAGLWKKFGKHKYSDLLDQTICLYDSTLQVDEHLIKIINKNKDYINKNYQLYLFNILNSKIYDNKKLICDIFPIMFDIDFSEEIMNIKENIQKYTKDNYDEYTNNIVRLFKIIVRCDIDIKHINRKYPILEPLLIKNKLITRHKEIKLLKRLFIKIEDKYESFDSIFTKLVSSNNLKILEELTKFNINFKFTCDENNWLYQLIEKNININIIIGYLVNIHKNNKLPPEFMNVIFDIYCKTGGYSLLYDNMLELVDRFILLNSSTFDFIGYKDFNGKTIIDRLNSITHRGALRIISHLYYIKI